jgi:hypothetical protein
MLGMIQEPDYFDDILAWLRELAGAEIDEQGRKLVRLLKRNRESSGMKDSAS